VRRAACSTVLASAASCVALRSSAHPLPPAPALDAGIGSVALASVESFDITPVQPIRPRRARTYLAATEAPPASAPSESDNIQTAATYVASAPNAEATLTSVVFSPAAEADKPQVKPHV